MIKVAIVEDNNLLRYSLEKLLDIPGKMNCVASMTNLLNIVSELSKARPDILIMDIGLPNISGIEGVRTVKANFDNIHILMFTVFEDNEKIFDAIKAGASGYLLKKTPPEEIIDAVIELYDGGAPMSPSIARKVIQAFQSKPSPALANYQLTVREKEILYSLDDGLSYKEIADKYCVSISTVRTHICNIYEKLHVHSRASALAKVFPKK